MESYTPFAEDVTDDTTIWRYMDWPRFISMLTTGRLWFAKAATLHDDPYEGFCNVACLEDPPEDDAPKWIVEETSDGRRTNISVPQMMATFSKISAEICENARDHLYVNSWCRGAESMPMWDLYGSHGCGVAVKSSVERYQRAAKFGVDPSHYVFGNVTYHDVLESSAEIQRDFSRGPIPLPGPGLRSEVLPVGLHKRSCYRPECEWRAVLYQDQREIVGVHEAFDLEQLISAVYVGPRAEEFIFDAVSSVTDKFLHRKPVARSVLLRPPQRAMSRKYA